MKKFTACTLAASLLLGSGCSSTNLGKKCDLDAPSQAKALDNIRETLAGMIEIDPNQYLSDDFHSQGSYNSKEHCTFLIRPWQPITTQFIWDGTLAFRVDKKTLKVDKYYRVDEG